MHEVLWVRTSPHRWLLACFSRSVRNTASSARWMNIKDGGGVVVFDEHAWFTDGTVEERRLIGDTCSLLHVGVTMTTV